MPIQSLNPATGQLLRSFEPLTEEQIEAKLALAAQAARTYAREPLGQRAFWMRRLAVLLEHDSEELAILMTTEMGKTLRSARAEVAKCVSACRFYAEHSERFLAPEPIETEHAQCYIRFDPLGVVLAIMPWNFPLWQVFRFLAPALMAGNVGLLKHASNVPQCALAIESLTRRAGFPRGVFQSLLIEARQVESVLADERVAAVTVTGSESAGRAIAAQAGWLIKKTVLELGGSDPFIVLPSADLDTAVTNAVQARLLNNGQSCIAAKRFLIHNDIYADFETRFVAAMQAIVVGDPLRETTDLGPIALQHGVTTLVAQVQAALAAGGRLLCGGKPGFGENAIDHADEPCCFFPPTVLVDVPRDAPVAREETFGPLALLFRIDSIADAIALANDTPFGLGASCWTTDPAEQEQLAAGIEAGCVFFNAQVASDPRLPFGGVKHSGYGRELSAQGMREFMNAKTVVVEGLLQTAEQPSLFDQEEPEPVEHANIVQESDLLPLRDVPERSHSIFGLSRRS
jgi:succinate-semialdehyde dehydrogenase/glutarate-semialdehyde dehydrogenase